MADRNGIDSAGFNGELQNKIDYILYKIPC